MVGAWSTANGSDGAPWMSQPGKQGKGKQIHGFVQVSTGHSNHRNATNPWLDFPGILGFMITPTECLKDPPEQRQLSCCSGGFSRLAGQAAVAVCPSLGHSTVPQQLLQLRTVLEQCCHCSRALSPVLAPQQGKAPWDKLKSAGFVGGHLSQHQLSAGALCKQLPKKPLLLMSFPPDHEPANKTDRAAPQQTPLTTAPSLLLHMSPLTSAEEWLCVFIPVCFL